MDRTEWMFKVAVNKLHKIDGKMIKKWIIKDISDVSKVDEVRCAYCDGEIRLHQGSKVEWHAEHRHAEDAIKCPGSGMGKQKKHLKRPKK